GVRPLSDVDTGTDSLPEPGLAAQGAVLVSSPAWVPYSNSHEATGKPPGLTLPRMLTVEALNTARSTATVGTARAGSDISTRPLSGTYIRPPTAPLTATPNDPESPLGAVSFALAPVESYWTMSDVLFTNTSLLESTDSVRPV